MNDFPNEIYVPDDKEWATLTKEINGNNKLVDFINVNWNQRKNNLGTDLIEEQTAYYDCFYWDKQVKIYLSNTTDGKKLFRVDRQKHILYVQFNNGDKQAYPYSAQ